jgi:hypothetical protein
MFRNRNEPDVKRSQLNGLQPVGFDPLADQLREEAVESWPDFSERLHQRILDAVGQRRAEEAAAGRRGQSTFARSTLRAVPAGTDRRLVGDSPLFAARRRQRGLTALLAAACLLSAVAVGWRLHDDWSAVPAGPIRQNDGELVSRIQFQWTAGDLLSIDDLGDHAAAGIDDLLDSAGMTPQSSPLTQDARQAADTLLRRLPIDVELAGLP